MLIIGRPLPYVGVCAQVHIPERLRESVGVGDRRAAGRVLPAPTLHDDVQLPLAHVDTASRQPFAGRPRGRDQGDDPGLLVSMGERNRA